MRDPGLEKTLHLLKQVEPEDQGIALLLLLDLILTLRKGGIDPPVEAAMQKLRDLLEPILLTDRSAERPS